MHGHYIGDPQVYRTKEDREDAADHDPIVAPARAPRPVRRASSRSSTAQAHEIVDAALEFAQNGTDPQPEDAMKNVYA